MKPNPVPSKRYDPAAAMRWAQLMVVVALTLAGLFSASIPSLPEQLIRPLCWAIVVSYLWSVWSWYVATRSLFDWYVVFLSAATCFNGGQCFLEVLNLNEHGVLDEGFSHLTLARTIYYVLWGLAVFHFGALLAVRKPLPRIDLSGVDTTSPETLTSLRIVGGGLLLIALPFSALLLREAVGIVMTNGYGGLYENPFEGGWQHGGAKALSAFLTPALFFIVAASRDSKIRRWSALGLVLIYAVINVFLGVRHEAATLLVALAWLWNRQIRKLNFALLAPVALFCVFVVFPLVAATRGERGGNRMSMDYLVESYTTLENPTVGVISEMGGSMMTISHTMDLVPAEHGFERGEGYAYAILTLFPNFFWDVHPTVARMLPSEWLIWQVDPAAAERGQGLGYSFIAEAYLNFGWMGLPAVMLLHGFWICKVVYWGEQPGRADRAAALATGACFAIFYVRAELAVIIRGVFWYAGLPYLAVLLLTHAQRVFAQRGIRAPEHSMEGALS